MLKSITLENFFSFGKAQTINLNPGVNVLVGINASGKSNFIKAIRLISEGQEKEGFEKLFVQEWGGYSEVVHFGGEGGKEIGINMHIFTDDNDEAKYELKIMPKEAVYEYILVESPILKSGFLEAYINKGVGKIKREKGGVFIDLSASAFGKYDPKKELVLANIIPIKSADIYSIFDTTPSSPIRDLSPYYSEKKLLSNGNNLAMLLSYLSANHGKAYDKIIEQLKKVNPQFRELVFTTPLPGKTYMALKEKNLERAITADKISDGTLRFLLYMCILYNPNRGKLICLDEPEVGLHPDMINLIAEGIKYAANDGTQIILATHSPLLLNAFELEDLRIFEKDEQNNTVVLTKSAADFPDWEGEFLVGQMWLQGLLGGVRW